MATITSVKQKILALDPGSFQSLCDAYLSREGYPNIVSLGTKAGSSKTTRGTPDTYFVTSTGKYVFVEYTTQQEDLVNKIEADINKCLDSKKTGITPNEIAEIIYCHTSSNIAPEYDKKFRKMCTNQGINLIIIGIDLLADTLTRKYPNIVKDHLGLSIDTEQIQSDKDFVKQYDSNKLAAPLDTPFISRKNELEEMSKAFEHNDVVILSGAAGTGKTRLALEFVRSNTQEKNITVYCVHNRSLPIFEDLCLYFEKPGKYFVLVDDANQISQLKHIVEYANKKDAGYEVKILITVRDYAIKKVLDDIRELTSYKIVNIKFFKDDEIKELLRNSLGIKNEKYLKRIVRIAEGNARIAMIAGKIAVKENRLNSIDDVSQLYDEYYGRALSESNITSNSSLLKSAGVIAALSSLHIDRLESLQPFLDCSKLSKEQFVNDLYELNSLEIVDIYRDKAVKFSEQCFANFILKYVFYDTKMLSLFDFIETCFNSYRNRVIFSINTLVGVFRNQELHSFVENEVKSLWEKLKNNNSNDILEYIKVFHAINTTETLLFLQEMVRKTEKVNIPASQIDIEKGKNYQSVKDDIINILGGFAMSKDLDAAMDLFLQYYFLRPDKYIEFYHAINVYFSPNDKSYDYDFYTQETIIKKMIDYSENWNNEYITLLFLDISNIFLQLNFRSTEMNRDRKSYTMSSVFLTPSKGVSRYRNLIWEELCKISSNETQLDKIRRLLEKYATSYRDECTEIIKEDAAYITKIVTTAFKIDSLADYKVVKHLKMIFDNVKIDTTQFDDFLNSKKAKIYQLLKGPRWDKTYDYKAREKKKSEDIREFYNKSPDKLGSFKELINICREAGTDSSNLKQGISLYIKELALVSDDFLKMIEMVVAEKLEAFINEYQVIQLAFKVTTPNELYKLINKITDDCIRNTWMYAYFDTLPEEYVNVAETEALICFLKEETDANIRYSCHRSIEFLSKFESIEPGITIKCVEIIFSKRNYSKFIAKMYFEPLFNEYQSSSADIIAMFKENIGLLENIYVWLIQNDCNVDYNGKFLVALYQQNNNFISKYIEAKLGDYSYGGLDESSNAIRAFFECEDYIEIFDKLIDIAISTSYPMFQVAKLISSIVINVQGKEENHLKSDSWIKHFIETYSKNKEKMQCLFEALSEILTEQKVLYVKLLTTLNKDFEFFKDLPLESNSYSGGESFVPAYQKRLEFFEKLLPLFSGIEYINHKSYILKIIDNYKIMIVNEEISNIIEN